MYEQLFLFPEYISMKRKKRYRKRGRKPKVNNRTFYKAEKEYNRTKSKAAWDTMFTIVLDIALSCCKQKANGIRLPDLEGKALDATLEVMKRYTYPPRQWYNLVLFGKPELQPYKAKYIVTVVRWAVVGALFGKNLQLNERAVSRDQMLEDMAEKETNNISNGEYNGEYINQWS